MQPTNIKNYVTRYRKSVGGWFSRTDAEIFATIMIDQFNRNVVGDTIEIGVHHGRSFIILNICLGEHDRSVAVDIFDQQEHNLSNPSGRGDYKIFERNMRKYGDFDKTTVIKSSSMALQPSDLMKISRGFRFVSIDGGHDYEFVLNDLKLTTSCMASECVLAIDDFFNPDYPEVAAAYYAWRDENRHFIPLCISQGKLYLCTSETARAYTHAMRSNKYLAFVEKKNLMFLGHSIPAYTGRYSGIRGFVGSYTKFYSPKLHDFLRTKLARMRRHAGLLS